VQKTWQRERQWLMGRANRHQRKWARGHVNGYSFEGRGSIPYLAVVRVPTLSKLSTRVSFFLQDRLTSAARKDKGQAKPGRLRGNCKLPQSLLDCFVHASLSMTSKRGMFPLVKPIVPLSNDGQQGECAAGFI
jgi:hypothetical protein